MKHADTGISIKPLVVTLHIPRPQSDGLAQTLVLRLANPPRTGKNQTTSSTSAPPSSSQTPPQAILLTSYRHAGLTFTQGWSTANSLDTKVELEDKLAKGVKWELLTNFVPHSQALGAKTNLHYKLPNFHGRAFVDLLKGPTATIDAVVGQNGFLVGAETGYDVQKAAITRYSAAVGYVGGQYSATVAAANNFSLFSAAYYHRVNSEVEAGAKAVWDSKAGNNVGLEIASKYRLDPSSWAKVCSPRPLHGHGLGSV